MDNFLNDKKFSTCHKSRTNHVADAKTMKTYHYPSLVSMHKIRQYLKEEVVCARKEARLNVQTKCFAVALQISSFQLEAQSKPFHCFHFFCFFLFLSTSSFKAHFARFKGKTLEHYLTKPEIPINRTATIELSRHRSWL